MNYRILFPCQDSDLNEPDENFVPEINVCKAINIKYHIFDYDKFLETGKLKSNIDFDEQFIFIYRGWMLKPNQYKHLTDTIFDKSNRNILFINNPWEYSTCHCFPNIYPVIQQYTPRIIELKNWGDIYDIPIDFDFFIKDSVKSNKTEHGVERISKDINRNILVDLIASFVKDRGKLFTGNIVLKEFINLKKVDNKTNEWRVFYFHGDIVSISQNSDLKTIENPPLIIMLEIGRILKNFSKFFTVDFALKDDNQWIVIETGDGQVSGIPTNEYIPFYTGLLNRITLK